MRKIEKRLLSSQSGSIKTELKSSTLFELTPASLNDRYIFLLYALKSSQIGQFARVKVRLSYVGHI